MLASAARSLVVEDARANPAFATRPATEALGIGAYSGVSLRHAAGQLYGTLCTLNPTARFAHPGETELLALAGSLIMQAVDGESMRAAAQRRLRDLADHTADLRRIAEVSAAVAAQTDLGATLDHIVRAAARSAGLQHISILMLDAQGRTLRHATSVELPAAYIAAIDGVAIGPEVGTCGAAAYHGETVITEDLCVDPAWDAYRHLALPCGFRAVWSAPLMARQGRVLGTLAAYQTRRGRPTENQRDVLELYARLAAIAVENARSRASEERLGRLAAERAAELTAVVEQIPDGVIALDRAGRVTLMNESGRHIAGRGTDSGRPVPERADAYQLRDAATGRALTPGETPLGRALRGETVRDVDMLSRGPADSADRYVRASAVPLRDAAGDAVGAVGVFSDVTSERTLLRGLAASEERLRTVYHAMACGVIVLDSAGAILDTNEAAQHILGHDLATLCAEGIMGLRGCVTAVEGAPPAPLESPGVLQARRPTRDVTVTFRRPDGAERCLHLDVVPILADDGRLTRVVLSFIDVTARARAEAALRASEQSFAQLFAQSPQPMWVYDRQSFAFLEVNEAAVAHYGYTRDEFLGMTVRDIRPPEDVDYFQNIVMAPRASSLRQSSGVRHRLKDGRLIDVDIASHLLSFAGHDADLIVAYDVTERTRIEQELRQGERRMTRLALYDALTDLPNRVLLQDRLARELAVGARSGASIALLLLDLDGFKEINDTLGHTVGDLLLRQVGARLCGALRADDTVARLGGDEFAALLPGADEDGARAVAHTIIEALDAPFVVEGQGLRVGGSIGIALAPAHGTDADGLLRRADVAMYAAKRTGGAALYDPAWDAYGPLRLTIMNDLRQAIAADGLVLHYQPKVDLTTGRVAGVEALVRWPHAAHGLIPPDQFIPLAEQSGVIVPLTVWVLETALRQGQAWLAAGHKLDVAVNLSARALREAALPETVERLLVTYGVAPAALTLEITESALMTDPTTALAVLRRLAACGVRLSIDDFGTGYSSLAYLKNLPVDEVKVDKSFVRGLGPRAEARDFAIVAAVLGMARSLGLDVVAEGVETESEWAALSGLRCDTVQGFLVSRPLPAPALDEWLRTLEGGRVAPYWIGAKIA